MLKKHLCFSSCKAEFVKSGGDGLNMMYVSRRTWPCSVSVGSIFVVQLIIRLGNQAEKRVTPSRGQPLLVYALCSHLDACKRGTTTTAQSRADHSRAVTAPHHEICAALAGRNATLG